MSETDPVEPLKGMIVSEWGTVLPDQIPVTRRRNGKVQKYTRPVSKKLDAALHYHVLEGMSQPEAASKAGITYQALNLALKRPHIHERIKQIRQESLTREGVRSLHRVKELRDQDRNLTVALDASRYLASLAGIQPPDRAGFSGKSGNGRMVVMVLNKRNGAAVRVQDSNGDTVDVGIADADHDPSFPQQIDLSRSDSD